MANYRIIRSNELYHFGVPGMRWGHRKMTASYYSKKVRKLNKLDKKARKQELKAQKFEYKSAKLQDRNSTRAAKKSAKYKDKANTAATRAAKATKKGAKIYQKLERRMQNTPVSDLRQRDLEDAKRFAYRYLGG